MQATPEPFAEANHLSEGDFERLVDAIPDAVVVMASDGSILVVNQQAEAAFGYQRDALLGQPIEILLPERFRQRHVAHRATYMAAPRVRPMGAGLELSGLRSDGEEFPVEISLSPMEFESEFVVISTIRDITARKQAEAERESLLAREQALVSQLQSIQALTDAALAHLELEDLLQELLRRVQALLVTDTAVVLLLDAQGGNLVPRAALGLEEEVEQAIHIPFGEGFAGRVASERRPISIEDIDKATIVNPLLLAKGIRSLLGVPLVVEAQLLGVLHVGTLKPRRFSASDTALLQLAADRVALAIDRARLYEAARTAVRMRNEFLSAISHDLGNSVSAIRLESRLLRDRVTLVQAQSEERQNELGEIADGLMQINTTANQLWGQVEELLDLARLQVGRSLELNWRPTDLVSLVREQLAIQQETSPQHELRLLNEPEKLIGEWDTLRLQRVVANLLSNAIKYSPEGGEVTVRLSLSVDPLSEQTWAELEVEDHGLGIPAEDLPRIFERFRRGSNVVGRFPGTGIGLAGTRQIIEQHGGTITVESEESVRTMVRVRLPA